jgi:hypothetical protein
MRCLADAQRLPWSRVRRSAVIAVDTALALGTGATAGLFGAAPASAALPTPGWAAQTSPAPTGPEAPLANPYWRFESESCTSAVFCVAVGTYLSGGDEALIDTLSDGSWSAAEAPLPSNASSGSGGSELYTVTCPADGSCVAVGYYYDTGGQQFGLIDTLAGGRWSAMVAPMPSDAQTGSTEESYATSITCPSVGDCVTAGNYTNGNGVYAGFFDSLSGGTWTSTPAPAAPAAAENGEAYLKDISCFSLTSCVATGNYLVSEPMMSTTYQGELYTLANGTWTDAGAPLPADAATGSSEYSYLRDLSCAGNSCEVVGDYNATSGDEVPLLDRFADGSWSSTLAPFPAGAGTGADQNGSLNAVSCTADGGCSAVGYFTDTSDNDRALAETLTGGVPTAAAPPQPTDVSPSTQDAQLVDVSCIASGDCTAVGDYENNSGSSDDVALIDTDSGGSWTSIAGPVPGDAATGNNEESDLSVVSCTSRGACDAAGQYLNGSSDDVGFLDAFTPMPGYWEVAGDGGIFTHGNASFDGSQGATKLNAPIVGMAATPGDGGYWEVASDGGIFTHGNAPFLGSLGGQTLNKPIVGMAATPDGRGYWLVAADGGIFNFGDAQFYGSLGNLHLNKPIVGMAATADGKGYWLVASDGGVFTEGDAQFYGSMGGQKLNAPIVGMAVDATGLGYWLVASDGGVFSFGDALFHGSTGAIHLNKPIVGLLPTFDGGGYWEVASDGGIFAQGDAQYSGSQGATVLNSPVVNGAPT